MTFLSASFKQPFFVFGGKNKVDSLATSNCQKFDISSKEQKCFKFCALYQLQNVKILTFLQQTPKSPSFARFCKKVQQKHCLFLCFENPTKNATFTIVDTTNTRPMNSNQNFRMCLSIFPCKPSYPFLPGKFRFFKKFHH